MDLSLIKDQAADFGTFVDNINKFFKNIGPAAASALTLLDASTWTGFFEETSSAYEGLSS